MSRKILLTILFVFFVLTTSGCAIFPKGDNAQEKRDAIQKMKNDTLAELYTVHPQSKDRIKRAEGYAVFNNFGINVIYFAAGAGWGVAHDNKTEKEYYMKMISGGVGLGLGLKDFKGVFVFKSRKAFSNFIDHGWGAGVDGDVVAKSESKGGGAGGAISVDANIDLYRLTTHGLAVQATIQGTKYYLDDELN